MSFHLTIASVTLRAGARRAPAPLAGEANVRHCNGVFETVLVMRRF